ncbi:hypothetical protein ACKGJO_06705 [Gracilimonas sp. Q87]|uniref:hypothetical protein n=1 Tax=Gracilimonas sp. Q87 TaxID=3384766 RepID=UPI00398437A7
MTNTLELHQTVDQLGIELTDNELLRLEALVPQTLEYANIAMDYIDAVLETVDMYIKPVTV